MADQRTMTQLLQAPTEGYEDAIVVPSITADNFELKHGLLTLVQNKQFYGHDKEDPHAHIRYFNKITSTLKFQNILNTSFLRPKRPVFVMKSPISNNGLMNLSVKHGIDSKIFFEPIPIMGFSELHQLDTFYNALNSKDQDSLNSVVGDNLLDKMPRLLLDKKGQNQSPAPVKAVEESCVTCAGTHSYRNFPAIDGNVYRDNIQEFVSQASAVNYNQGNTSYRPQMMSNQIRPLGFPPTPNSQNVQRNNQNRFIPNQNRGTIQSRTCLSTLGFPTTSLSVPCLSSSGSSNTSASTSSSGTLPSNTIANPKSDLKAITTRSGVSYDGPQIPPPVVENKPKATKDIVNPTNNGNTEDVQPQAVQSKSLVLIFEPAITPVSASKPNPKASILYPSRRNDERNPLIGNKEKLSEMARTPLNEHCFTVLLKKIPEKLGDPGKFLIPCDFS
nr:hypothetical protein [Tanacetum cinerariifolium]